MRHKINMQFFIVFASVIGIVMSGCTSKEGHNNSKIESKPAVIGSFMNMTPTLTPKLLAPDLLASSLEEYNGTFNPSGTEFYFTTNTPAKGIICYTKIDNDNKWIKPRVAEFSGVYSEYDPLFSPDGSKLYFSSERPTQDNEDNTQSNIWYVEKDGEQWSVPIYVDLKGYGNYYSSVTNNGTIYFNVWDNGDLFKASPSAVGYEIEKLSAKLNSKNGEGDPFISPDEDYIIFRGYNNSLGNGDLYISYFVNNDWTEPENLGEPINSKYHEICPYVTSDGKFFIFSSSRVAQEYISDKDTEIGNVRAKHKTYDNGELNIYYMSAAFIEEGRAKYIENE